MNKPVYPKCTVPASEVARIKGLGFLRDKTTEDKFNCRVLTVNGRVSSDFMRTVAEAADKFGTGKLAMTSRMTVEIQGIAYSNIDDFIAFLTFISALSLLIHYLYYVFAFTSDVFFPIIFLFLLCAVLRSLAQSCPTLCDPYGL